MAASIGIASRGRETTRVVLWHYVLTEYIETKGAESHYEGLAEECHHMLQQVNQEAIRAVSERTVFNPAAVGMAM